MPRNMGGSRFHGELRQYDARNAEPRLAVVGVMWLWALVRVRMIASKARSVRPGGGVDGAEEVPTVNVRSTHAWRSVFGVATREAV